VRRMREPITPDQRAVWAAVSEWIFKQQMAIEILQAAQEVVNRSVVAHRIRTVTQHSVAANGTAKLISHC